MDSTSLIASLAPDILLAADLGLLITDEKEMITDSNVIISDWLGVSSEDLMGKHFKSLPFEATEHDNSCLALLGEKGAAKLFIHWKAAIEGGKHQIHYFRPMPTLKFRPDSTPRSQRAHWFQFLDYEISRSRRYDNPLSVMKLKLAWLENEPSQNCQSKLFEEASLLLRDELRWADMISSTDQGEFLIVLPETDAGSTGILKDKIESRILRLCEQLDIKAPLSLIGIAHWHKGDSSTSLINRARDELIKTLQAMLETAQEST